MKMHNHIEFFIGFKKVFCFEICVNEAITFTQLFCTGMGHFVRMLEMVGYLFENCFRSECLFVFYPFI